MLCFILVCSNLIEIFVYMLCVWYEGDTTYISLRYKMEIKGTMIITSSSSLQCDRDVDDPGRQILP